MARAFPTLPKGETVASFETYPEAQAAVDKLAKAAFPVKELAIVGTDLDERRAHHGQAQLGPCGRGRRALGRLVRHVPRAAVLHLRAHGRLARHPDLGGAHRRRVRHDLQRRLVLGQPPPARLHLGQSGARHAVRDHRRVRARRAGALGARRRRAGSGAMAASRHHAGRRPPSRPMSYGEATDAARRAAAAEAGRCSRHGGTRAAPLRRVRARRGRGRVAADRRDTGRPRVRRRRHERRRRSAELGTSTLRSRGARPDSRYIVSRMVTQRELELEIADGERPDRPIRRMLRGIRRRIERRPALRRAYRIERRRARRRDRGRSDCCSCRCPGPGWLVVFLGLAILGTEFAWAKRLAAFTKRQLATVLGVVAARAGPSAARRRPPDAMRRPGRRSGARAPTPRPRRPCAGCPPRGSRRRRR